MKNVIPNVLQVLKFNSADAGTYQQLYLDQHTYISTLYIVQLYLSTNSFDPSWIIGNWHKNLTFVLDPIQSNMMVCHFLCRVPSSQNKG